jgi:hypothetical protein
MPVKWYNGFTMEVISSDTGITIGLLIAMSGAVVFFTKLWALSRSNRDRLHGLELRVELMEKENREQADRLARIETKIDILLEQIKK